MKKYKHDVNGCETDYPHDGKVCACICHIKMKELWLQAVALLPPIKDINSFFLAYRPWIKDKTHLYLVTFLADNFHKDLDKWFNPWRVEGFGRTPEEALQNFIDRWNKYADKK